MQGLSITEAETLRLTMRKKENTCYDKHPLEKKNHKNPKQKHTCKKKKKTQFAKDLLEFNRSTHSCGIQLMSKHLTCSFKSDMIGSY